MSDSENSNVIGVRTVYDALLRLEGKFDMQAQRTDTELEGLKSRIDRLEGRLEGSVGMLKWLGPTGVLALIVGLLYMAGVLPAP